MTLPEIKSLDYLAVPAFVLTVNNAGVPVYSAFNKPAQKAAGKSLSDVLGRTAEQVYHGAMGKNAFAHHMDVVRTGKTVSYDSPFLIQGVQHVIRTVMRPTVENGRVVRMVGTVLDITTRNNVQKFEGQKREIDAELEQFISLAAHDLRTPLRNVRMLADLLRDGFEDLGDGKIEMIGMLEGVVEKAAKMITDVLSNVQTQNLTQSEADFDLGVLCTDIVEMLDPLGKHGWSLPAGRLLADKVMVQIVLRNLIDNAIKHSDKSRVAVDVEARSLGTKQFELIVRDDGAGMANPALVFLDSGVLRTESGFGLFGIRRLILRRGGEIRVETPDTGVGVQVTVTLPGTWVQHVPSPKKQPVVAVT